MKLSFNNFCNLIKVHHLKIKNENQHNFAYIIDYLNKKNKEEYKSLTNFSNNMFIRSLQKDKRPLSYNFNNNTGLKKFDKKECKIKYKIINNNDKSKTNNSKVSLDKDKKKGISPKNIGKNSGQDKILSNQKKIIIKEPGKDEDKITPLENYNFFSSFISQKPKAKNNTLLSKNFASNETYFKENGIGIKNKNSQIKSYSKNQINYNSKEDNQLSSNISNKTVLEENIDKNNNNAIDTNKSGKSFPSHITNSHIYNSLERKSRCYSVKNKKDDSAANKKQKGIFPLIGVHDSIKKKKQNKLRQTIFGDDEEKIKYLKFIESKSLALRANLIMNNIQNTRGGKQELRANYNPKNV